MLESVKLKQNDLENDMQLKYNTYTTLMAQLKAAVRNCKSILLSFTTIQGAEVPVKPSGPKRMLFVLEMFISAFYHIVSLRNKGYTALTLICPI